MLSQSFDTHNEIKQLIANGIPEAQAEAITGTIKRAQDTHLEELATKKDVLEVKSELRNEITEVKGELKLIKWMLALIVLVNVLPTLKSLFGLF